MRVIKTWQRLWVVLPALVILPPVGWVMLWKSPRQVWMKALISALFLCIAGSAVYGVSKAGYGPWAVPEVPANGIAVEMDERNRYIIPEIQPKERKIYAEVVKELSEQGAAYDRYTADAPISSINERQARAFERVAERHPDLGLDADTVERIYLKVSISLVPRGK